MCFDNVLLSADGRDAYEGFCANERTEVGRSSLSVPFSFVCGRALVDVEKE